jgi:hypothetical protein
MMAADCSFLGPGINLHPVNRFHWYDHISPQTLENMCLALVQGKDDESILNHYRVAVYTKAASMVARLPETEVGNRAYLHGLLRSSKEQYESTALAALTKINLLTSPSLSLLQALLSGVRFEYLQDLKKGSDCQG